MLIAWTTIAHAEEAHRMAKAIIEQGLASCVQIEPSVTSYYRWQGKVERSEECRLTFKFLPEQHSPLEAWIRQHHPYETPEWIVIDADFVGEKYLSWAKANSTSAPL
jgi:periplasmic divalent cation tolerance protein